MHKEHSALLALGSNLGDREAALRYGLDGLAAAGVRVLAVSSFHETEPVGGPPQGPYLNGAALVGTALEPLPLLRLLQTLERGAGRAPGGARWGPRRLDPDLLLFEDRVVVDDALTVPHPRMMQRRFVLEPASEVAPDLVHPISRRTVRELLEDLS
jgi:2-amino-4-hydroxy-6-hydroxymethyldihydropteridine diphosphokinase